MEYRKDIIMRTVQSLVRLILKILASIEIRDEDEAQEDIDTAFRLLGKSSDFFTTSDVDTIFEYLESIDSQYQSILPVSQLIYCQALIVPDEVERKNLLIKSKLLLELYIDHTTVLSTDALKFSRMVNIKLSKL